MRLASRRGRGALVVLVAVIAITVGIVASVSLSSDKPSPPAWLHDYAVQAAANLGDTTPSSVSFALVSAADAAPMIGLTSRDPGIEPDRQVYLLVMRGQFTDDKASVLAGNPPPQGDWVIFAIDTDSHEVSDYGIGKGTPPEAKGVDLVEFEL